MFYSHPIKTVSYPIRPIIHTQVLETDTSKFLMEKTTTRKIFPFTVCNHRPASYFKRHSGTHRH